MAGIPANIVIMWSGAIVDIPEGWFLCDGANGTPDLRNRFIYGVSPNVNLSVTGGSADAVIVSHNHTVLSISTTGAHSHGIPLTTDLTQSTGFIESSTGSAGQNPGSSSAGAHSHTITLNSSGESATGKNMPPYYALAYIMYGGE